ncbi:MAG: 50S ribosomal protein L11 methyltransferase [Deltaproteobacteria bacterium]|nr:50S ribosomal protein L11 methyltransferase [Deltaproteobacteria bacterium]
MTPTHWMQNTTLSVEQLLAKIDKALAEGAKPLELYKIDNYAHGILREVEFDENTTIVDFGCGTGVLTVATLVSGRPFKKIYAVDISEEAVRVLKHILDKAALPGRENVEIILSQPDDALLPADSADIIVAANIRLYPGRPPNDPGGFLKKRYDINMRCMRSLVKAMKPDAVFREYFGLAGEDAKLTDLRRELMLRFYREAGLTMESLELAPLIVNDTGDETGATFLQGVYRLADTEPGR